LLGIAFAAGIGPNQAAAIEVRGRKTGRKISFPVVVVPHEGDRYLVAMLGDKTNCVRNVRALGRSGRVEVKRFLTLSVEVLAARQRNSAARLRVDVCVAHRRVPVVSLRRWVARLCRACSEPE
jgi:hypothetical protein